MSGGLAGFDKNIASLDSFSAGVGEEKAGVARAGLRSGNGAVGTTPRLIGFAFCRVLNTLLVPFFGPVGFAAPVRCESEVLPVLFP